MFRSAFLYVIYSLQDINGLIIRVEKAVISYIILSTQWVQFISLLEGDPWTFTLNFITDLRFSKRFFKS